MAERTPITDRELKAIVNSEIHSALGELTGDLSNERAEAMDYYYGEPTGKLFQPNADRSSVVITTLRDTVEWMMPQLMRMFAQADEVMTFAPVGEEDEEAAKQETQAINHIFWRQNEGFLLLYIWFKDALLQKNGYVKYWIEETDEKEREEYDGVTPAGLAQIMAEGEYEIVEHEESVTKSMDGEPLHRIVIENQETGKRIVVENIPPEKMLVSDDAKSVDVQTDRPRFIGHYDDKTKGQLKNMGFNDADIEEMMKSVDLEEYDAEEIARYNLSDEQGRLTGGVDYSHESQRKAQLIEGYLDIDMNGDGFNQLIKVYCAGNFIEWEPADQIPFACLTPYINPHKHLGQSEYDMVHDLQEISTQIFRNVLDNMYQTNNMRPVVNENVDLDSLLTSRPGAPIYTDGNGPVMNDIQPFAPPPMWNDGLGILEYTDTIRKDRTGIGDETMGLDANTMANANTGVMIAALDSARGKIELVARIFAETGIKWLFRGIHELCRKNYDQKLRYELSGEHVEVDPQAWKKRTDITVNVGIASGSREKEEMRLAKIGMMQQQMVATGGLGKTVLPSHIYEQAKEMAEALGSKSGDKYFLDPMLLATPELQQIMEVQMPQPKGPDPQTQALMANAQIEGQKVEVQREKNQLEFQLKSEQMQLTGQIEQLKLQLTQYQTDSKSMTESEKMRNDSMATETQNALDALKLQLDDSQKAQAMMIDLYQINANNTTKIDVEAMKLEGKAHESALDRLTDLRNQAIARVNKEADNG